MTEAERRIAYATPLRARKAIVEWIFDNTEQRGDHHGNNPFCFDVKCHNADISLRNLFLKWKKYEGDEEGFKDFEWRQAVRAKYKEVEEELWAWGVEDARRTYRCGREGEPDGDGVRYYCRSEFDGPEPLDVLFSFIGRSGGWLSLDRWEGNEFHKYSTAELREAMLEADAQYRSWEMKDLRRFYAYIVQLKHETRPEAVKEEIEYQAAFNFFANACSDLEPPKHRQLELFERDPDPDFDDPVEVANAA